MTKYKMPKIEEMLEAGVHFGHQVRRWNPKMEKYIYTVSKNSHIIDLEQTEALLKDAAEFLYETAKQGKKIVFVGTKKQAREIIEAEAKQCGVYYVNERWVGGTLTNFKNIRTTVEKFLGYIRGKEEGRFDRNTKKERLMIDRQIARFQTFYGGIASMTEIPSVLFIVDPKREKTAVREAKLLGLKVVSLIDTNGDPTNIDKVIPGNDDAIRSIALVVKTLSQAIADGYKEYNDKVASETKEVKSTVMPTPAVVAEKGSIKLDEPKKTEEVKKVEAKPAVKKAPVAKAEAKSEVKKEEKPAKTTTAKKVVKKEDK